MEPEYFDNLCVKDDTISICLQILKDLRERMSFISQLATRFPGMAPAANAVLKPSKSLEAAGQDIMVQRFAYWYRYLTTYGDTIAKAKTQFPVVKDKIMAPAELTYRELAVGSVCGLQIYGAYVVGEMLGRKSIIGYNQGKKAHH
eukprot:jgi/Bigna1/87436/estExt_fgenesh1_pg.C_200115